MWQELGREKIVHKSHCTHYFLFKILPLLQRGIGKNEIRELLSQIVI
jgi:hypothetical protein